MNYSFSQIQAIIERISPLVLNQRILKIRYLSSSTWSFQLSSLNKTNLVISLSPVFPFIDITSRDVDFELPLSHFLDLLKQTVTRCVIDKISMIPNNRIVCLSLHRFSEAYKELKYLLYVELIPNRTNLVITDHLNKILLVLNSSGLDTKRPLLIGLDYYPPLTNNEFSLSTINETPEFDMDSYFSCLFQTYLREKFKDTIDYINKRIKSISKKLEIFQREALIKEKNLEYKTFGNLLLTYQSFIKIDDFVEIEGKVIRIDKNISIVENANNFFKIYHKSQAALVAIERESKLAKIELAKLVDLVLKISSFAEVDFEKLASSLKLEINNPNKKIKTKSKPQNNEPFTLLIKGTKISFGKNRFQNDYLTFSIAKPTDWFFHSKDSSGAHVILHHETPSNAQMQIAAELALALSHQDGGEVIYAQVKTLKKGGKPGLVITTSYKTYRVVGISEEIKNTIIESKR